MFILNLIAIFLFFFDSYSIGTINSKNIGKNQTYLAQTIIAFLSGKLSDQEKNLLKLYLASKKLAVPDQKENQLLGDSDMQVYIPFIKQHHIAISQVLGITKLRYNMISNSEKTPWFLQEIGLLPLICNCKEHCLVDAMLCKSIDYFNSLIDHLDRNIHRIETEEEKIMFLEAIQYLANYIRLLRPKSSQTYKRIIDQALERLILIKEIFAISNKYRNLNT